MKKNALIVDNDFTFVEFLSDLLAKWGYHAVKAYDGKEGIGKLENHAVDILFADLVLPKVDGKQLFKFVRNKYRIDCFPIIALSGVMIENIGSLDQIGADYFIAKGPPEKLAITLNDFMAKMESQPSFPSADKKVWTTGNIHPRRDAVELVKSLQFHQAVIESAAVGIIIVDNDTHIINANPASLEIVGRDSADVINRPVSDLFDEKSRAILWDGLELVMQQNTIGKVSVPTSSHSRMMNTTIAPIKVADKAHGWVIIVEPVSKDNPSKRIKQPNP